jgi:hypothetical protein
MLTDTIEKIRSDKDSEYVNETLKASLRREEIYIPSCLRLLLNICLVDVAFKKTFNMTRCILQQSKLPVNYWSDAIRDAVFITNIFSTNDNVFTPN